MAQNIIRTDDLDKISRNLQPTSKLEKVGFPDDKRKKETERKAKKA